MSFDEQIAHAMAASRQTAVADFERRAASLRVPSEPEEGASGSVWLFLRLGEKTIKRRFWCDNSLNDVKNYVMCQREAFEAFGADPVQLVNTTTYPASLIGESDFERTIQALDMWPSGRIAVQALGDDPTKALPPAADPDDLL